MSIKKATKRQRQRQATMRIFIMVAILICANILASYVHTGLDLTSEKRFTLSRSTEKLLKNMQETAVVEVYLSGKFPAGLQRLQESVRERLNSFRELSGNKVLVRFIDPLAGKTVDEQKVIVHNLEEKGIRFMQLNTENEDEGEYSTKIFFPYALVQYNGQEASIMLLEDPPGKSPEEKISYAEAMLEYKFASAINKLSKPQRAKVAYVVGNGEDLSVYSYDMLSTLPHYYDLDTIDISRGNHISLAYDAIMICAPTQPFTGVQKAMIDQYIMHGGKVLWTLSFLNASLDTLAANNSPQMIAMPLNLNIDDMLFRYGVRVNNDLVEDMQCLQIERKQDGVAPEKKDWIYFPRINPVSDHPIVRNMDYISAGFTNSIDTIRNGIKKTVLLQSSKYSRTAGAPERVSLSITNYPMQPEMFNKPFRPLAVLLEGNFRSVFEHRLAPETLKFMDSINMPFKAACDTTNKMIVTSIGDIFRNDYATKDGILPMGYYKWTGEFFANKHFLLNCLEYLTDNSGILETRSKEVKLRLLDAGRARKEKTQWQVVNVAVPIAIVLLFASVYLFIRKRKYEVKQNTATVSKQP